MDRLLQELLAVDSASAFNFFAENLRETVGARNWREDEALYVASVLAHYAQTSRADSASIPVMSDLSEVFDRFLLETTLRNDAELLEMGGSQVLLFAGFFRDQMQRRHNVNWYDQIGQSLYERAGHYSSVPKKRQLFDHLAASFPAWTAACRELSRTLRDNRLLLKLN
jgi:hypothetical protein